MHYNLIHNIENLKIHSNEFDEILIQYNNSEDKENPPALLQYANNNEY